MASLWTNSRAAPAAPAHEDLGLTRPERPDAARIWAVGGGKGGVGKSAVTSGLATAMAGTGRRVVVVDADLGGANLHTLLGVRRPRRTLSDLLTGEVASLEELMVQTPVRNLWLVSGNQALLEMANPKHSQKEMISRHIRSLDVDEVFLDLGAGSAFNVLDFFLLARRGLVVVTPEATALENADHFLRAAFYRALRSAMRRSDVSAAVQRLRENGRLRHLRCASELIEGVREIDPPAAKPLEDCQEGFRPLLLVNQVQTAEHRRIGPELVRRYRERLGIGIELAGSIDSDPNVPAALAQGQPTLQAFPLCRFSHRVEALARRLQRGVEERAPSPPRADRETIRIVPAPPAPPALPPLDLAAPGAYLRRCREALSLTLDEMIERTRIRSLAHIESERFDLLPPEPYLKGYVLEYARELGVADVAGIAKSYLGRLHGEGTSAARA